MKKNNRNRRFTRRDALAVHVEANKSDPFASRRLAMTLAKHTGETKHVIEEGQRLVAARAARIKRIGVADWVSPEQMRALSDLRSKLPTIKAHRERKYKPTMSQYKNRADYNAAVAA